MTVVKITYAQRVFKITCDFLIHFDLIRGKLRRLLRFNSVIVNDKVFSSQAMSALASCRFPYAESPAPGLQPSPPSFNSEPGETFVAALESCTSSHRLLHHFSAIYLHPGLPQIQEAQQEGSKIWGWQWGVGAGLKAWELY